jgi:hypothetical protein
MLLYLALGLVVLTVAASLLTGKWLGERRKELFQLERQADDLRRRIDEIETTGREAAGQIRALRRLRDNDELLDELARRDEGPRIDVAAGLKTRSFELAVA